MLSKWAIQAESLPTVQPRAVHAVLDRCDVFAELGRDVDGRYFQC